MFYRVKAVLVSLLLVVFWASLAYSDCPVGDLNEDCQVDVYDVAIFAGQWLDEGGCIGPNCADFDGFSGINLYDFGLLAENWHKTGIPVVINEFMASNSNYFLDPCEPNESPDWIELYNNTTSTIDLSGKYLTDQFDIPTRWQIPSGVTIDPCEHLIFFADGDDDGGDMHTNFKLSAGGEDVGLFDSDGITLISGLSFDEQTADVSYGRYPDATISWRFMGVPTPGAENDAGYIDEVADTKFSIDRGFYNVPFYVAITTETEGAAIRYTLDGSEPTLSNGYTYSSPIYIDQTTYLRAAAFKSGWLATNVDTHTYFFLDDVITQSADGSPPPGWPPAGYSTNGQYMDYGMDPDVVNNLTYADSIKPALMAIPTFSIVTNLDNLVDAGIGIYVNAGEDGIGWERPASLELIYPDGSEGFQINSGLRIRGGKSRGDWYQHSFHVFFRGEYGDATLEYPLFGDEGVDEFNKIDFRIGMGPSWTNNWESHLFTFVSELFTRDMQGQMNQPFTRTRYYHLYLNGQYWGIFQTQEYPNPYYAVSYLGGEEDDYDIIRVEWPDVVAKSGNLDAYEDLWNITNQIAAASNESTRFNLYQQLQGKDPDGSRNLAYDVLMDFDNYIDYMLDVFYAASIDGPVSWLDGENTHNWFVIRNRNSDDGFKFFQHDAEFSMGFYSDDGSTYYMTPNIDRTGPFPCGYEGFHKFNPQWLHQQLAVCEEYRLKFADRAQKQLFNNGAGTPTVAGSMFTNRADQIDLPVIAESARWGDCMRGSPYTRTHWLDAVNWITDTYIPQRTGILLNQFINAQRYQNSNPSGPWESAPLWPDINAPAFNVNSSPQHGGHISTTDAISLTAEVAGTIYYTIDGNDPRNSGQASAADTLVPQGSTWRYLDNGSDQATAWREPGFNDLAWSQEPAQLGYGDGDEVTVVSYGPNSVNKYITTYFRNTFSVTNASQYDSLTLGLLRDDGAVVYLNGAEIVRSNMPNAPNEIFFNTLASSCMWEEFEESGFYQFSVAPGLLIDGNNVLAVEIHQYTIDSSDISFDLELIAGKDSNASDSAIEYTVPFTLDKSTTVKTRLLTGTGPWSALNETVFAVGDVVNNLRITEIMYHPQDTNEPNDPNCEFIELKNIGTETLNLNMAGFTNGVYFTFPDWQLSQNELVLIVRDQSAFAEKYGSSLNTKIAGQYTGSLNNGGERIEIQDAAGETILNFSYNDSRGWPLAADGAGHSLIPLTSDPNGLDYGANWRSSCYISGSPGVDDSTPAVSIVINEIMAHTDYYNPAHPEYDSNDWIELYNTTASPVSLDDWYLSDDIDEPDKWAVPSSLEIPAYGRIAFDEVHYFHNPIDTGFGLNKAGEQVILSYLPGTSADRIVDCLRFKGQQNNVSLGRYPDGGQYWFEMTASMGTSNLSPDAHIVIDEIMYHPNETSVESYIVRGLEYIELYNPMGGTVDLFNSSGGWRFDGAVSFSLPAGTSLPAGQRLIVVGFDPNLQTDHLQTFEDTYGTGSLTVGVDITGPYSGSLSNGGERLGLEKPQAPDNPSGSISWVIVDEVIYSDYTPWPLSPDGLGDALHRISAAADCSGNDPCNWQDAAPIPGG